MSEELMIQNIKKAQMEIDRKKGKVLAGKMRQYYHFMPQTGWMNDPNGLIFFKGKYHMFYQHNPYDSFWNSMHWGHAVSDDMIHWEYLPLALAPSESYDNHPKGGCFSGSALEYEGKLYVIYTSASNTGRGNEQTQSLAISEDGIHFHKYEGNPIITPPGGVLLDSFRDPKIWRHGDEFYLICSGSQDGFAKVFLYRSRDLKHWEFFNILTESRGEWGSMWECPDLFPLGDQYVLTYSPVGVGDHTAVYQVGDLDYTTGKFQGHVFDEIDWGFEFYAPQSLAAPDGRKIIFTWANEWEWMPGFKDWGPTFKEDWCGYYNVPREVRMTKEGTLQFLPIEELKSLRERPEYCTERIIGSELQEISAGNGISFELKFLINLEESSADSLEINFRCGDDKKTVCVFDFKKGQLTVDRSYADGWSCGISRSNLFLKNKKYLDVHIFSDQSSLEIFTDQYQNNHSSSIFASDLQNKNLICAHGGTVKLENIEGYGLKKVEAFRN